MLIGVHLWLFICPLTLSSLPPPLFDRLILRHESAFFRHRFTQIDTDKNDQMVEPFLLSVLIGVQLWLSCDSPRPPMCQSLAGGSRYIVACN